MSRLVCPPCRQDLNGAESKFYKDLWVDFRGQRVYVCCSGCVNKMIMYWDEYIEIIRRDYSQLPSTTTDNLDIPSPVGVNPNGRGVCSACATGLCMLKEHLPPSALKKQGALGSTVSWVASLVHSPDSNACDH